MKKTFLEQIKDELINRKTVHIYGLEDLIIIKMAIFPNWFKGSTQYLPE